MQDNVGLIAVCEKCSNKIEVTKQNMEYMRRFVVAGDEVFLSYYSCPDCAKVHFVQIDNVKSIGRLQTLETLVTLKRHSSKNKKLAARIKKAQSDLQLYRAGLVVRYADQAVYIPELDVHVGLVFSVVR